MSSNLTIEQELALGALELQQKLVRDELAILRKTRSQREVGSLKIPAHLAMPDIVLLPGQSRDPRACSGCGRGLRPDLGERGRFCNACASNPSTDIGVEERHSAAPVLPAE